MPDSDVTGPDDSQTVSYQPTPPLPGPTPDTRIPAPFNSQFATIRSPQSLSNGSVEVRTPATPNIPGYEILSVLGRGGMGVVYKAREQKRDRVVALKVLLAGAHASASDLARFRTEATTAAQLQHPNVIQIYEVGDHEGVPYLAVEYVDGGDLHKWLAGRVLPVEAAARLVYTLARAVGTAHQKGIVHRDIKPANILVTSRGVPKVADFGLAKQFGDNNQTTTGAVLGTPQYMSPEQAAGLTKRVGPTTDVYSLGVILYEMLTGRVPLIGESVIETLDRVRFVEPIPVRELRAEVPQELAAIVRRCLNKIPEERYRSADELADHLAQVLERGVPTQTEMSPEAGFPYWVVGVIGTILLLLLTAFVIQGFVLPERTGLIPATKPDVPRDSPSHVLTPTP